MGEQEQTSEGQSGAHKLMGLGVYPEDDRAGRKPVVEERPDTLALKLAIADQDQTERPPESRDVGITGERSCCPSARGDEHLLLVSCSACLPK